MAQTLYVDALGGSDSGAGTEVSPYATITYALAQIAQTDSRILVKAGIYREGEFDITGASFSALKIQALGDVTIDCAGYTYCFDTDQSVAFDGFKITGFSGYWAYPTSSGQPTAINCLIYSKGNNRNNTYLVSGTSNNGEATLKNTTTWGIKIHAQTQNLILTADHCTIVTDFEGLDSSSSVSYNASNYVDIRGSGGWDTVTYAPPFISENADNPDLRYNTSGTYFNRYATYGENNQHVGYFGRPVVGFINNGFVTGIGENDIWGSWENDDSYYDDNFEEVIITSANNKLDFDEGSGELTATIADGTYTSGADLATEIQTKVNVVANDTHTITYSDSKKIAWASDGSQLDLKVSSGSNVANGAWAYISYTDVIDRTGQNFYVGETPLVGGVQSGAPADATPVIITSNVAKLDMLTQPLGQSGRLISNVADLKKPTTLKRVYIKYISALTGAIDNSSGDATRQIEVRADNIIFDKNDGDSTTDLDWTLMQYDGAEDINETYRYWQFRVVLRLDAVS